MDYKVVWQNGCAERLGPGITNSSTGVVYPVGSIVKIVTVQVKTAGYEEWGQLENGRWIATVYAGSLRAVLSAVIPPPTDDVVLKSWQIVVLLNGVEHTFSG